MASKNKALILGFGISGKAAAKALAKKGFNVFVYDDNIKSLDQVEDSLKELNIKFIFNSSDIMSQEFNLLMKSPGIKPSHPIVETLKKNNIELISDLELGYMFKGNERIIAVTGTNGKTTTTSLINYMLNKNKISSDAVGNIGVGAVDELINTEKEFLTIECSSFQLNDIKNFKADIAVITNISSDHLDYHGSVENYIAAKLNLLKNLTSEEYAILNFNDKNLKNVKGNFGKVYFSSQEKLENGFYCDGNYIYLNENGNDKKILYCNKLKLKGMHNFENVMCALGVAMVLKLDLEKVALDLYEFESVKHRLQFVKTIKGVEYYNDSKGTNADSTIKALNSFTRPIILIMGGYDKKEDFSNLLEIGKDKIKDLIVYGQTKDKIIATAKKLDYKNIFELENLKKAVELSYSKAEEGNIVLFSPACASWDMYKNYEVRGDEFISLVNNLE